jgi:hypothetical protein
LVGERGFELEAFLAASEPPAEILNVVKHLGEKCSVIGGAPDSEI